MPRNGGRDRSGTLAWLVRNTHLDRRWADYERDSGEGEPVILEPSYYKYSDPIYEILQPQWKHFVDALVDADHVVVIGYSLPEGDSEARMAITLGFQANSRSRWIVINRSERICERYRQILGTSRVTMIASALEDLEPVLQETLTEALNL